MAAGAGRRRDRASGRRLPVRSALPRPGLHRPRLAAAPRHRGLGQGPRHRPGRHRELRGRAAPARPAHRRLAAAFGADVPGATVCDRLLERRGHRPDAVSPRSPAGRRPSPWRSPTTATGHWSPTASRRRWPPTSWSATPPPSRAVAVHIGPGRDEWLAKAQAAGSLVFADVGWDPSQRWPAECSTSSSTATCSCRTPTRRCATPAPTPRRRRWPGWPSWCRWPSSPSAPTARIAVDGTTGEQRPCRPGRGRRRHHRRRVTCSPPASSPPRSRAAAGASGCASPN